MPANPHVCDGNPANTYAAGPDPRLNLVLRRHVLGPVTVAYRVYVPGIARSCAPGQFLIVRGDVKGERVPLTIADYNPDDGWIEMVIQVVGAASRKLASVREGDRFRDIVGPLGKSSDIEHFGTVCCVGGGLGIAPVYPIQRALKEAGNRVISIIGARNRELLFWEDRMRATADELHVLTDDGSHGEKGFVTDALRNLLEGGAKIDRVIAVGPPVMMRAVAETTRPFGVKTIASLNSIMVDGTGMCGGCRVEAGGKTYFACVDGPEFDAHAVNFDILLARLQTFHPQESHASSTLEERNPTTPKKAPGRTAMPNLDPEVRRHTFDEVALGYSPRQARMEALRCLQCRNAPCVAGCPVNVDIPGFIREIRDGHPLAAARVLKLTNNLPAVCGRVCPQETQCEKPCVLSKKGDPIAIGRLERFAADAEADAEEIRIPDNLPPPNGMRVAVVGAGPAGLTAAADLALLGYAVTVFEALHAPGGVLAYGIPEFRLPKAVVQRECDYLESLGVEFRLNVPVGPAVSVPQLLAGGFGAVFIGTGAGLPAFMKVPGEHLKGVGSANEFLTRINLMKAYRFPEFDTPVHVGRRVAVIGGGNVAMDAARSALRMGAEEVSILYRRTRAEMPARAEEVEHAVEEGVSIKELVAPVALSGDEKGWLASATCIRMELGEPDASGRRRPVEIPDSQHEIQCDQLIVAIGTGPNPVLLRNFPGLVLNKWGYIPVDGNGMTNLPGVFAVVTL